MIKRFLIGLLVFLSSASLLFSDTEMRLELDANIEFDLSLMPYPPMVYPVYYYPTRASTVNPQGIVLTIAYNRIGPTHSASYLYLATRGSVNFSPSILLTQLYFAPDGEPLPPVGQDPPGGNWRPYNFFYQNVEQFRVVGSGLMTFRRLQDYIFKVEADDEPGNWTITLYYRLYGL